MKLILLFFIKGLLAVYREKKLETVSMAEQSARLYNGIKHDDHWTLKSGNSGSLINMKEKNTDHDEWSFEVGFSVSSLMHPEFAGVYLWYTEDPIRHGGFKGAAGKYNGVMAGVEFVGKSLDIVISVNHGEADYTGLKPEETELKDSPDPAIFKGHSEFIFKVISTAKNFKVEIYDKNRNILYDRVRYTSMTEIGSRLSGKYFGISTDYAGARTESSINLKSLALYEREETEKYNPTAFETEIKDVEPRLPHEIGHPTDEIQHTISGIEHMTKYLRIVLGEPQNKPIAENIVYLKKAVNFQSAHIYELRDALKSLVSMGKKHSLEEQAKREELLFLVQHIHTKLTEPPKIPKSDTHRHLGLGIALGGIVLFVSGFLLGRRFAPIRKLALH